MSIYFTLQYTNGHLSSIRVLQRYEETGLFNPRPGSGRRRATTVRDYRFIVSSALRHFPPKALFLRSHLQEVRNVCEDFMLPDCLLELELQNLRFAVNTGLSGNILHENICIGQHRIGVGYCTPMKLIFVPRARTDVLECGEDQVGDMHRHVLPRDIHLVEDRLWQIMFVQS